MDGEHQTAMLAGMNENNKLQAGDASLSRSSIPLTANQLRAGRAIARLGIRELASASGLSTTTISHLETGRTRNAHQTTMRALRAALTAHGVDFALGGWTRHLDDAHGVQSGPPESITDGGADDNDGDDGDDGDGADDDSDADGEPNGPDWQEFKQWLVTVMK